MKKYRESLNRLSAKEQGFFDGRFMPKVVPDKKKKTNKICCRKTNKAGFIPGNLED